MNVENVVKILTAIGIIVGGIGKILEQFNKCKINDYKCDLSEKRE